MFCNALYKYLRPGAFVVCLLTEIVTLHSSSVLDVATLFRHVVGYEFTSTFLSLTERVGGRAYWSAVAPSLPVRLRVLEEIVGGIR